MPEMLDVLDANGEKTGQIAARDEIVHRDGLWHRTVDVAVIDDYNRILLQQRSMNKLTNPGKWDIATAGHVDAGEDSPTTAKRELLEEVGLAVDEVEYLLTYRKETEHVLSDRKIIDKQFCDCFLARVPEIDLQKLKLQTSEVQAVKICTLPEFEAMVNSGTMVDRGPLYAKMIELMRQQ